jgi:DNA-binding MarR family transcriptional regulator
MQFSDSARDPRRLTDRTAAGVVSDLTGLISEVFLLQGRLTSIFAAIREVADLSGVETLTLSAVISADRPVTVPQIGRSLGHARQVVQRAANVLEGRGLLTTKNNPGHKRAAFLVPTPAGLELKRQFDGVADEIMAILARDLDPASVRDTRDGLRQLRKVVERQDRVLRDQAAGS